MSLLLAFLMSVAASVAAYYICKWLDRHGGQRKPPKQQKTPREQPSLQGFSAATAFCGTVIIARSVRNMQEKFLRIYGRLYSHCQKATL